MAELNWAFDEDEWRLFHLEGDNVWIVAGFDSAFHHTLSFRFSGVTFLQTPLSFSATKAVVERDTSELWSSEYGGKVAFRIEHEDGASVIVGDMLNVSTQKVFYGKPFDDSWIEEATSGHLNMEPCDPQMLITAEASWRLVWLHRTDAVFLVTSTDGSVHQVCVKGLDKLSCSLPFEVRPDDRVEAIMLDGEKMWRISFGKVHSIVFRTCGILSV